MTHLKFWQINSQKPEHDVRVVDLGSEFGIEHHSRTDEGWTHTVLSVPYSFQNSKLNQWRIQIII